MKRPFKLCRSAIAVAICVLYGCSFQISSPKPIDPTDTTNGPQVDATGHYAITVTFTEAVDRNTVIPGKTLFLDTDNKKNAPVTLNWSTDSRTLVLTTVDMANELVTLDPDGGVSLRVIGTDTGKGVVKTTSGRILDGDYDKQPGGDYYKLYIHVG